MQSYWRILTIAFMAAALNQAVATNVVAAESASSLHLKAQELIKARKFSPALSLEAQASEMEPGNFLFHKALMIIYTNLGKMESALEEARQVIQLRPKDGKAYYNLAALLHQQGRTEEALKSYEQAIELGESDVATHRGYALCLVESGRVAEAVPLLEKLSKQYPENKDVWLNLAWAYYLYQHMRPAIEAIDKSLAQDPIYYPAVRLKAELLQATYAWNDAWSCAKRLIEIDKKNPVGYWILARFSYTGSAYPERAKYILTEALANVPQKAGLYYEMGKGFLETGKQLSRRANGRHNSQPWFTLAESSLKHALDVVPKSSDEMVGKANAYLAELLLLERRPYDALPYAQKAHALMPDNKDVETLLNKASFARNDLAGALKRWLYMCANFGTGPEGVPRGWQM